MSKADTVETSLRAREVQSKIVRDQVDRDFVHYKDTNGCVPTFFESFDDWRVCGLVSVMATVAILGPDVAEDVHDDQWRKLLEIARRPKPAAAVDRCTAVRAGPNSRSTAAG